MTIFSLLESKIPQICLAEVFPHYISATDQLLDQLHLDNEEK
jgi:hypothetical protein